MSTVVFNPTNETFLTQYVGHPIELVPGAKRKFPDPTARHILNEMGPRGLVQLDYGDNEEEKTALGKKLNLEFKKKQVIRYNETNEIRRQAGLPYITPPPQITEYADEVGIGIDQPYKIKDADKEKISDLMSENSELRKQNVEIIEKLNALMTTMSNHDITPPEDKTAVEKEIERNRLEYKDSGKRLFNDWVKANMSRIGAMPEENKKEIREKYGKLNGKELELE